MNRHSSWMACPGTVLGFGHRTCPPEMAFASLERKPTTFVPRLAEAAMVATLKPHK